MLSNMSLHADWGPSSQKIRHFIKHCCEIVCKCLVLSKRLVQCRIPYTLMFLAWLLQRQIFVWRTTTSSSWHQLRRKTRFKQIQMTTHSTKSIFPNKNWNHTFLIRTFFPDFLNQKVVSRHTKPTNLLGSFHTIFGQKQSWFCLLHFVPRADTSAF